MSEGVVKIKKQNRIATDQKGKERRRKGKRKGGESREGNGGCVVQKREKNNIRERSRHRKAGCWLCLGEKPTKRRRA
jgi:hypothetical protein